LSAAAGFIALCSESPMAMCSAAVCARTDVAVATSIATRAGMVYRVKERVTLRMTASRVRERVVERRKPRWLHPCDAPAAAGRG